MTRTDQHAVVVVALPFAYQDGVDKYNGIMRFLRETGADWELRIVRDTFDVDRFRASVTGRVAGVICGTAGCFDGGLHDGHLLAECLSTCRRRRIPLVGLDWPMDGFRRKQIRQSSFFNIDSEKVGLLAAEALLKAGRYASYGFVGMCPDCAWSRDRGVSFARGLRKAGHPDVRRFDGDAMSDGAALGEWLKSLPKPAGVFAANDCVADVVLKTCAHGGLRVPEDMSVIGVDDDPIFCVHTRPTLSSVHPDFELMGYRAARELKRLIAGGDKGVSRVVAGEPSVTSRMSTAPCSPTGMMIRRADEIIESRACQDIDSNAIADELKISRRLLDLRYRQIKGLSVREAIVRTRVRRAKHLLAYSGHSIGTICRMCGYRTESYLGKVFLRHEGVSMGVFRERAGGGRSRPCRKMIEDIAEMSPCDAVQ